MRSRIAPLVVLILAQAVVCNAAPPGVAAKQPWEWTIDERLADRFDPAKIRERRLAHEASLPAAAASSERAGLQSRSVVQRQPFVYDIDGSRNPELFLSYELFDGLLSGFDPSDTPTARRKQRAYFGNGLRKLGYEEEAFWSALESVSAQYLPLRWAGPRAASPAEVEARSEERCRERHDALQAARSLFGQRQFDRLLYTVVAPVQSYSEATLEADPISKHRRAEAGCR